jgi:hypothetical protein
MRWVKQYTNDGTITGYTRKPVATKVRKDHVDFLKRELKQMKTITMADLLVKLKEKYADADISRRHLTQSTESPIFDASFWSENGVSCPQCGHERNKIGDSVL